MKMRYISKIQKNLSSCQKLHSRKNTSNMLDGSYKSIFKGKSMNFAELREYVNGDDIKDMDWKASARSRKLLVRQYVAEKKHNIMLIFDSNCRMLADSKGLEEKRELAIMGAGMLAYFVNRNGDDISSTFAVNSFVYHIPFKTGLGQIERILEDYHSKVTPDNHSDINAALEYVVRNFRRKMILILVTDLEGAYKIKETNLKRLLVAHDILLLDISDADIQPGDVYNVDEEVYIPDFMLNDRKLVKRAELKRAYIERQTGEKLKKYGIANATLDDEEELEEELIELLNRHKLEKRQHGDNG